MENSRKILNNMVAIITGGARGIGAATARLFTENGAYVIVADILDKEGIKVAESIGGCYVHCDVSKEADVEAAVEVAIKKKNRLDIMFNNAGMTFNEGSILEMDADMVKKLISVNVNGVLHGIKHAAKAMIKASGGGGGSIICTSSSAGIMGGLGGHAYTLSKGAINGLVRTTACELGSYGIRVNSISPHGVPTDMLVLAYRKYLNNDTVDVAEVTEIVAEKGSLLAGRAGTVEDVAQAALFLASQESSGFVTGHNLVIDGGYTSATGTMRFMYN